MLILESPETSLLGRSTVQEVISVDSRTSKTRLIVLQGRQCIGFQKLKRRNFLHRSFGSKTCSVERDCNVGVRLAEVLESPVCKKSWLCCSGKNLFFTVHLSITQSCTPLGSSLKSVSCAGDSSSSFVYSRTTKQWSDYDHVFLSGNDCITFTTDWEPLLDKKKQKKCCMWLAALPCGSGYNVLLAKDVRVHFLLYKCQSRWKSGTCNRRSRYL